LDLSQSASTDQIWAAETSRCCGSKAAKEDADELRDIAQGQGSITDKAKQAAAAIREPGAHHPDSPDAQSQRGGGTTVKLTTQQSCCRRVAPGSRQGVSADRLSPCRATFLIGTDRPIMRRSCIGSCFGPRLSSRCGGLDLIASPFVADHRKAGTGPTGRCLGQPSGVDIAARLLGASDGSRPRLLPRRPQSRLDRALCRRRRQPWRRTASGRGAGTR
jgi:hypothetical protein